MIQRPEPTEYIPYFTKYIDLVKGDALQAMKAQIGESLAALRAVSEEGSLARYQPGKWSLREVIGHLVDTERVFAFRALWFGRGGDGTLPGFEQDDFVATARSDERSWSDLLREFEHLRQSNILLFEGFDEEALRRRGTADGNVMSVRALAYNIAGHELHHMRVVREKYLPAIDAR